MMNNNRRTRQKLNDNDLIRHGMSLVNVLIDTRQMALLFLLSGILFLTGCAGYMNPTGGNSALDYPFFITNERCVVKKISIPAGTKLVYEEHFFKEGQQDKMMSEEKLIAIEMQNGATIDWGGVPVTSIEKFFNSAMCGFTVYADFNQLSNEHKTTFSELWQSCSDGLGIKVQDMNDWSFNKNNISDIESCSVNYQRYFKENAAQQKFLDDIYAELMKTEKR